MLTLACKHVPPLWLTKLELDANKMTGLACFEVIFASSFPFH